MPLSTNCKTVRVGGRSSPLSQVQIEEVYQELSRFYPQIRFEITLFTTYGDQDRTTSLRGLEKTDFFTKELDEALLAGNIDAAIHSAKDLPEPLPEGLTIAAITEGLDPADSLILKEGWSIDSLPPGALIATSSIRREEAVRQLRSDVRFLDLRGTIHERLEQLKRPEIYGVVIAEAALIRLGLISLNRIALPGDAAPLQGKLAVICREKDAEIHRLFSCLHDKGNAF